MDAEIVKVEQVPQGLAIDRAPAEVLREAHLAAKALADVLSNKAKKVVFNNEQYLEFEDWQTVGKFYNVTCGETGQAEVIEVAGIPGFRASSVAYRNGQVISSATAYCMRDEPNWAKKPLFQLASMAQTRANAKVLRNVLAWVVVLAGYKATPAEEMDGVFHPQNNHAAAHKPAANPPQQAQPTPAPPASELGEQYGVIEKLAAKQNKKGQKYLVFTFNGKSVFVWDDKLFPFVIANSDKNIAATLETKGAYTALIAGHALADAIKPMASDDDLEGLLEAQPF